MRVMNTAVGAVVPNQRRTMHAQEGMHHLSEHQCVIAAGKDVV